MGNGLSGEPRVEKRRFDHGVVVSKVCYGMLERVFPICHAIAMCRD